MKRTLLAIVVGLAFCGSITKGTIAGTITISDFASGSITPPISNAQSEVNGDFLIDRGTQKAPVGDGINENTFWKYDFTGNSNYLSFLNNTSGLVSATLTLQLTPHDPLITTDSFGIVGLGLISFRNPGLSQLHSLPVGRTSTVSFDLLQFYTPQQIRGVLDSNAGQIPMEYQDDAIVSFAQLNLSAVPEPSSVLLLGFGVVGVLVAGSRYSKRLGTTRSSGDRVSACTTAQR